MIRKIGLAFVAMLAAAPLLAATHTWSGAASASFADGANWTGGSPAGDAAADLVFPAGGSNTNATNDLAALTVHSITFSGGTYTIRGNPITVTSAVSASGGVISGATGTLACDINISSSLTLTGGRLTLSGSIGGSGSVTVHGSAPAGVTFAGSKANTYTGETIAVTDLNLAKDSGVIAVPGNLTVVPSDYPYPLPSGATCLTSGQINPDAVVTVNAGWLTLGPGTTTTLHHLVMQSTRSLSAGIDGTGRLIVDNDILFGQQGSFPAPSYIQAELNLPHTLTFDIAPAFLALSNVTGPGGLTVRSGTVGATGSFAGAATVSGPAAALTLFNPAVPLTVTDGASGGGKVQRAEVIGGTLTLFTTSSVAGDLTLDGASTLSSAAYGVTDPQYPSHPFVSPTVGGTVTLSGAALKWSTTQRSPGAQYTLIDNRGSSPVNGTFAGIPEGGTTPDGLFRVTYRGGDGNDVVLTDISRVPTLTTISHGALNEGQPVTLKAAVSTSPGTLLLTGTITFTDNGAPLGSPAPDRNGLASVTFTPDPGAHQLKAAYSGDAVYEPSASDTLTLTFPYPAPVLTSVTPKTVPAGGVVTIQLSGDGFYPNLKGVDMSPLDGTVHYVSRTQATLTLDLTNVAQQVTETFAVANDTLRKSSTASLTITPRPATISLSDGDVFEGTGGQSTVTITARLTRPLPFAIVATYHTSDGTAVKGEDYIAQTGQIRFAAGQTEVPISLTVIGDANPEPDETFTVTLSDVSGIAAATNTATVTIRDDDSPTPRISVDDAAVLEGASGTSAMTFHVTLSGPATQPVTVDYATSDGSAAAPADYVAGHGTLTFAPGETAKTVTVIVNGDTLFENTENLFLTLSNASGGMLARAAASGTILNDDFRRRAAGR